MITCSLLYPIVHVKHGDHFPDTLGTDQSPERALTQDTNGRVPLVIIEASNLRFFSARYHLTVFIPVTR